MKHNVIRLEDIEEPIDHADGRIGFAEFRSWWMTD